MTETRFPTSDKIAFEPLPPRLQLEAWFRLALAMTLPVLLLLVGITLTR